MWKHIKRQVVMIAAAALTCIASNLAQAQTPPKEILLTNNAGCKLYHSIGAAVIEAQLLNVAGNCVNEFFQSAVLLGIGWTINITEKTRSSLTLIFCVSGLPRPS
jgi:hypothetical protein